MTAIGHALSSEDELTVAYKQINGFTVSGILAYMNAFTDD
ncbi:predicted protein [Chaetomium globosum CBS 148.51]|uniref:Uncharacterized protein n=1 Tax=Chaetomium globosum (strain ATCC 6205 / CBS 148.51 / DSM 1962 / NBRC 6347 / NRRL 1970) TaxID=306901 RepID=Q2GMJ6_CHAGB|nr:uncharacterized protein CHGG_10808 [Chaetomium globosum CBS 148.51]EAQ82990.1 predicted protein [Chaetomium globosum CBS 148.51]